MGRPESQNDRVRIDLWMHKGLHDRLLVYRREFRWSKTKIIEDALAIWLNARDAEERRLQEAKRGLAEVK